jgi:hypothetical protein
MPYVMDLEKNSWKIRVYEYTKRYLPFFIELKGSYLIIVPKEKDVGKYLL